MNHAHSVLITLPAALLGVALVSCGGTTTSPAGSASPTTTAVAGALGTAQTALGRVLVDHRGRTVYVLTADSPGHSTCNASCLGVWPPVAAPGATAPAPVPGVAAKVGVTRSTGGATMLTAAGWPLYTFAKDTGAGQVHGQGIQAFGGTWYVIDPSGQPVKAAPTTSGGDGGSKGGGGYGY